ncbi:hypothetical protein L207DRAFT_534373 [Hyaloscypha variabilis F]|uniref:Uncharacterized protein n=1 Tax=Hyaloscypha variabilis (strain UAMH 11265 / GT02V1 / F) TaxID=1149755 RepID=A0A2J6R649_HYAVF|nr:hypothetical protein L207DRAFT_534373 [Hyaloscypha variabilis F]
MPGGKSLGPWLPCGTFISNGKPAFFTVGPYAEDQYRLYISANKSANDGIKNQDDLVNWDQSLLIGWQQYWDGSKNPPQWKRNMSTKGHEARRKFLVDYFRERYEVQPKKRTANSKHHGSKDSRDLAVQENAKPIEFFRGTTIPRSIDGIASKAYEMLDRRATNVIRQFLDGKIFAELEKTPREQFSTLEAIESAFWKKGFRINRANALRASKEVKSGEVTDVMTSKHWEVGRAVIAVDSNASKSIAELLQVEIPANSKESSSAAAYAIESLTTSSPCLSPRSSPNGIGISQTPILSQEHPCPPLEASDEVSNGTPSLLPTGVAHPQNTDAISPHASRKRSATEGEDSELSGKKRRFIPPPMLFKPSNPYYDWQGHDDWARRYYGNGKG